ncbi:MAG: hypothetical protein OXP71_06125 [Candidatus Poribacteria bacterium]|nr:hypothetical protein [Candidatus Poribacteria bacterium]
MENPALPNLQELPEFAVGFGQLTVEWGCDNLIETHVLMAVSRKLVKAITLAFRSLDSLLLA